MILTGSIFPSIFLGRFKGIYKIPSLFSALDASSGTRSREEEEAEATDFADHRLDEDSMETSPKAAAEVVRPDGQSSAEADAPPCSAEADQSVTEVMDTDPSAAVAADPSNLCSD